jgi:hypothetical protein
MRCGKSTPHPGDALHEVHCPPAAIRRIDFPQRHDGRRALVAPAWVERRRDAGAVGAIAATTRVSLALNPGYRTPGYAFARRADGFVAKRCRYQRENALGAEKPSSDETSASDRRPSLT